MWRAQGEHVPSRARVRPVAAVVLSWSYSGVVIGHNYSITRRIVQHTDVTMSSLPKASSCGLCEHGQTPASLLMKPILRGSVSLTTMAFLTS